MACIISPKLSSAAATVSVSVGCQVQSDHCSRSTKHPKTTSSLLEFIVTEKKRGKDHLPWRCTLGISFILFKRNKSTSLMLSQNNFFSKVKQKVAIMKRERTLPGAAPSTSCCCNMRKRRERSQPGGWRCSGEFPSAAARRYLSLQHWSLLSHQTFWLQLWRHLVDVPQPRLVGLQVLHPT